MTKTLLINCSLTGTSGELRRALELFSECMLVGFKEVTAGFEVEGFDAVVLSGSGARIVNPIHRAMFRNVAELIRRCNLPLLGICFGHQLLCQTLGANVGSLPKGPFAGFENIIVIDADGLFDGFESGSTVPLAENHNDYVLNDGLETAGFSLLADSPSCEVEAVKHKTKPFYGVQFHPERITLKEQTHPEGHKVIKNFYWHTAMRRP